MLRARPILAAAFIVCCFAAVVNAGVHVRDGGNFFSPQAAQSAEASLEKLQAERGRNVVVETFDVAPPEVAAKLQSGDEAAAFRSFGQSRARSLGAELYILANRKPGHLRVLNDAISERAGISAAVRDQVSTEMLTQFKAKDFDRGLLAAVATIEKALADPNTVTSAAMPSANAMPNRSARGAEPGVQPAGRSAPAGQSSGMGWLPLILLVAGVVIAWKVLRSVMARSQSIGYGGQNPGGPPATPYGQPGYGQQPYGQPGYGRSGGGFGRGLLGGLLGGAAGGYFANRAFGQGNNQQQIGDGGLSSTDVTPTDSGYADSGGSFDTDSGGGFGGGDSSGGGDAGGGDSGGSF